MRLLGVKTDGEPPEHIRLALESAAKASEATDLARGAVDEYWASLKVDRDAHRDADQRLRLAKVDARLANERQGRRP